MSLAAAMQQRLPCVFMSCCDTLLCVCHAWVAVLQEPLVAAGRLLEFEARRPGCSPVVLELLGVEYGSKVGGGQLRSGKPTWCALHLCQILWR